MRVVILTSLYSGELIGGRQFTGMRKRAIDCSGAVARSSFLCNTIRHNRPYAKWALCSIRWADGNEEACGVMLDPNE